MSKVPDDLPIRVLIVDDHAILREGVAAVLARDPGILVVGEAENGAEGIKLWRQLWPDVTLMDLQMPGLNGVDAITALCSEFPFAKIIVFSTYGGDVQALRALKAGAVGYLLKSALRRELADAIRAVHAGRRYILPEVASEIAFHAVGESLTKREVDILRLIAAGNGNKQVAGELNISEDTVKSYLKSVFAKLDVTDRTAAVVVALKRGIIDIQPGS